jgi:hypothetical protein
MTVPELQILAAKTLLTIVNGEVAYSAVVP